VGGLGGTYACACGGTDGVGAGDDAAGALGTFTYDGVDCVGLYGLAGGLGFVGVAVGGLVVVAVAVGDAVIGVLLGGNDDVGLPVASAVRVCCPAIPPCGLAVGNVPVRVGDAVRLGKRVLTAVARRVVAVAVRVAPAIAPAAGPLVADGALVDVAVRVFDAVGVCVTVGVCVSHGLLAEVAVGGTVRVDVRVDVGDVVNVADRVDVGERTSGAGYGISPPYGVVSASVSPNACGI
jgi:hypothetical protein